MSSATKHPAVSKVEEAIDVLLETSGVAGRRAAVELLRGALDDARSARAPTESEQVMEFMLKFGHMFVTGQGVPLHLHPPTRHPRHLTLRKAEERHVQMQEEVDEFYKAMHEADFAGMADALVDVVYFAKGTACLMGLPWDELWADVHAANMRKERGSKIRGGRSIKVDAVKPPGWQGPRTLDVLRAAGYDAARDSGVAWDDPEHAPGGEVTAATSTMSLTERLEAAAARAPGDEKEA